MTHQQAQTPRRRRADRAPPLRRTRAPGGPAAGALQTLPRFALGPGRGAWGAVQTAAAVLRPARDRYEVEADAVADRVTSGRSALRITPLRESALPAGAQLDGEGRASAGGISALSGGHPLPAPVRRGFEPHFGMSFGDVRVHTDARAGAAAGSMGARAFTVGADIAFAPGQYRPGTGAGDRLLAHELTHVVQQRGLAGGPVQAKVVQLDEDDGEEPGFWASLVGSLRDRALSVVEEYAPSLARVLERGPLEYVKDLVVGAYDSIVGTIRAAAPQGLLEGLQATFAGLVERAQAIVAGLASGSCEPLFAALNEARTFVVETAGAVWDRLGQILEPVGDFFGELWDSFGAPAVEWIQRVAGDVWEAVTGFGRDLWDWTAPVREAFSSAWGWVREQLFGADEGGEGSEGIIGWIQRKAGEAFDELRELTRPVWEPVAELVATVRSFLPPAFATELGASMSRASEELTATAGQLGGGEGAVENRESLASFLPSVEEVLASVRSLVVGTGLWLAEAFGGLQTRVTGFLSAIAGLPLVGALAGPLSFLGELAAGLLGWARQGVGSLFARVVSIFDLVSRFVRPLLDTLLGVAEVVGDVLRLPQLVLGAFWNLIPHCIRDPIKDFLVEHILAHIPILNRLVQLPELWAQVQEFIYGFLRRVFRDGDLSGALLFVIQTVLELVGIPLDWVLRVFGNALGVIGDILLDPFGFMANLFRAVTDGAWQFAGNILTHLGQGLMNWLFGTLGELGIRLPSEFSVAAIFDVVLQVLGITLERLEQKARDAIGDRAVDLFLEVWGWISTLVREGIAGIWREIQERLSDLWGSVIGGIRDWVVSALVQSGVRFIANLSTGYGAIIEAILAIYNTVMALAERFRQILSFIESVTESLASIARGETQEASDRVELSLASAIPIVLGLFARWVGLGDPGEHIRRIVERIRATVDRALDWLIEKAIGIGRRVLGALGLGGEAEEEPAEAPRGDLGETLTFEAGGERHTLWIERRGSGAEVMVQSEEQPVARLLTGLEQGIAPDDAAAPEKRRLITAARRQLGELDADADAAAAATPTSSGGATSTATATSAPATGEIAREEGELRDALQAVLAAFGLTADPLRVLQARYLGQPLATFAAGIQSGELSSWYQAPRSDGRINRVSGYESLTPVPPGVRADDAGRVQLATNETRTNWTGSISASGGRSAGGWLGSFTGRGTSPASVALGLDANGHLVGAQFGGPNAASNISRMQRKINAPSFSTFENALNRKMQRPYDGATVSVAAHMQVTAVGSSTDRVTEWQGYYARAGVLSALDAYRGTGKKLPDDLGEYLSGRPSGYQVQLTQFALVPAEGSVNGAGAGTQGAFGFTMPNPIADTEVSLSSAQSQMEQAIERKARDYDD